MSEQPVRDMEKSGVDGVPQRQEIDATTTAQRTEMDATTTVQRTEIDVDNAAQASEVDIRIQRPQEPSRASSMADLEKDAIRHATLQPLEPDPKHLSADSDADRRHNRESVESRLSIASGESVLSDDGEDSGSQAERLAAPGHARSIHSRGNTTISRVSVGSRRSMPPLRRKETKLAQKEAHPWQHLGITLGLPAVVFFDLVLPIIIYYSWYNAQVRKRKERCDHEFPGRDCPLKKIQYDKEILGFAIISFGFGELWILLARAWRLYFKRDECAPLLSRSKWELDATSWVYGVAMIFALIPFVIGAELELTVLYLYSPSFIMGFLGILMVVTTLCPFKIPIGINSHARGSGLRPFIYYAAEDFIAVDGLQDREFRIRYNERYETNKMFRQFFRNLTLFWILGVAVYIGSVSAVIFTLEFHYAFGLSLGVLFSYIGLWSAVTALWVKVEMRREHKAYEDGAIEA